MQVLVLQCQILKQAAWRSSNASWWCISTRRYFCAKQMFCDLWHDPCLSNSHGY